MSILDNVKYLGLRFGDSKLSEWLLDLGITAVPRLERGDTTAHISNKERGVEITFKDERIVNIPGKSFPDGALITANIRFYGKGRTDFAAYQGNIGAGLTWDSSKAEVRQMLGVPNFPKYSVDGRLMPGEDDWKMRWDRSDCCLFFTFDDNGGVTNVAIQLPLDQA